MTWETFLKAHWGAITATDFFTVEVVRWRGLVRYFVLFVIDLKARRIEIAGISPVPDGDWMRQIARWATSLLPTCSIGVGKVFVHYGMFGEPLLEQLRAGTGCP